MIDRDNNWNAKALCISDMATEIRAAFLHRINIFMTKIGLRNAAIHFHRAHGRHDDSGSGLQTGFTAFDVKEFFSAKIGSKSRFRDCIVCKLKGGFRSRYRVTPMGNIGKGPPMNERWRMLQSLNQTC